MTSYSLDWAYALGRPGVTARFRTEPEDFRVDELLGFEPSGTGEHVVLQLQKRGDNTPWLARQIAQLADVGNQDVGYCGLKDRHAVTTQWFSIYLPKGEAPDWTALNSDSVTLLQVSRHERKLRPGMHLGNRFEIRLRDLEGDREALAERLSAVAADGVPNYFGEQRFGIESSNLVLAEELLVQGKRIKNRQRRGLALSAARSYLFNQVLSARVEAGTWTQCLPGEASLNEGASGPLWGRGRLASEDTALALEQAVLAAWTDWCHGLEHVGLSQERRVLRLRPEQLRYDLEGRDLVLRFALPPGTYATAVLRELCVLENVSQPQVMV